MWTGHSRTVSRNLWFKFSRHDRRCCISKLKWQFQIPCCVMDFPRLLLTGIDARSRTICTAPCGFIDNAAEIFAEVLDFGPHALRATAATNALDHGADIDKVQEWLGHANIATTRIYDRRTTRPEDSPTFKVSY